MSEKGGATVDLGFNKGGFNAGLSYNSKTGKASGSVGLEISQGSSLGISYNEGDGFGASISKSLDNGINGSLSWSEKGGVGGNIGYEVPGDKNKSKDSLANKMQGSGGSLNWSQRDGVSVAVNASGGVNAGNWSQSGGFQANTNFLTDQWKANFVSKQGAIEELQSQGLSKEQATAILDASAQEESKAAQNKNNQETGKSVLDGAGYAATREDHDHDEFSYGIGGDDLKKGLKEDGFGLTSGEKKFVEDRMKLDQAKAQGAEAYMAALKKGNIVERMPDSVKIVDGKEVVSKQGAIEELQSQGLSKEQATAILDASAQEESKAAQNKNNQETGKSVLDGAGYAATREDHDHDEFSYGIGGDDLKKGLKEDGFGLTSGEKKFVEDRMKLDQAKAQGAEAYMAALKKGNIVERMPDSVKIVDGKEVKTYRHSDTDTDGSNVKIAMQATTDPKTGKTTYAFARQQEFDLHSGVAPIVNLKDGKIVVNSPFGERWGRFHNGNDLAHSGNFMAPVDIENVKVTQGKERTNENGKAVGIWKESKTIEVKDPVTGKATKTKVETLHTMQGDKPVPYTREMATADYNAHPAKNQTYDQLMATPANQMSKDGNSVSGTYRIGDQDFTLRFKHIQDLNQVRNSDGSFKTTISKGNAVGVVASTGYSTGNHGHFQVESGSYLPTNIQKYTNNMNTGTGKPSYSIDPVFFLNKMAGPNEVSEGRLWQRE
ncbi:hypothetical protein [Leptospira interrogans]|uniref:hypothetical protein n=1 Tax=Leptospira interrogans TaxID=173 RepID=UPI003990A67D